MFTLPEQSHSGNESSLQCFFTHAYESSTEVLQAVKRFALKVHPSVQPGQTGRQSVAGQKWSGSIRSFTSSVSCHTGAVMRLSHLEDMSSFTAAARSSNKLFLLYCIGVTLCCAVYYLSNSYTECSKFNAQKFWTFNVLPELKWGSWTT